MWSYRSVGSVLFQEERYGTRFASSHFELETEVFFANVKKNHFLKYKWMKKNNFNKSGLPTVMKKIIEVAI